MNKKRRQYNQPTFTKNGGIKPSKLMRDITRREIARNRSTFTPVRRDFRTPREHIIDSLKGFVRTAVWPTIL